MHEALLKEVVKNCQLRQREGDCPTTKGFSVKTLEDAVIQLALSLKIALDPDVEIEAGIKHWEAPHITDKPQDITPARDPVALLLAEAERLLAIPRPYPLLKTPNSWNDHLERQRLARSYQDAAKLLGGGE